MEFERAIYRVYERCLEGLREDQDSHGNASMKSCKFLELVSFVFGMFMLTSLIVLHAGFVGSPGCLPAVLGAASYPINGPNMTYDYPLLKEDQILYINIDKKFQPQKDLSEDDAERVESAMILRDPVSFESSWFGFRSKSDGNPHSRIRRFEGLFGNNKLRGGDVKPLYRSISMNSTSNHTDGGDSNNEKPAEPAYDYKFTFNSGLLMIPYQELKEHEFITLNVSLMGTECYGSSYTQSLIPLGGIDTVVVNALMNTLQQPGHVFTAEGDYFRWNQHDLQPYGNISEWVQFKVQILFYSVFAFFFLTTITALLVRILISSGVVLIFPIFWLLQAFGFAPLNLRIVAISYPWIGLPLEVIRARNQSITPFILGHISRVVIYYFLYQATQLVFAVWFYNRDSPGQQELWIFGLMMLWEYYSMIYVRALGSIQLFPRASLALFLIYHFYYFSFPSGFHVLALVTLFFFLLTLMVHCIRVYEMKDYERGTINIDQPRALYTSLPWPVWNADLAPEFTLMMPLSHRSVSAYQANIPAVPGAAAQTMAEGAAGATAGAGAGTGPAGVVNPMQDNNSNTTPHGTPNNSNLSGASGGHSNSSSSSSSTGGVEMSSVLRPVPISSSNSPSSSHNNNNHNNNNSSSMSRGNVTYSRLNSTSNHGLADGDHSEHGIAN